ncbi:hypothetical protein OBRU01_20871 [Operophtera brumata]|uniref:UDP-N-acetylglucosamine transferase subunit ALG14 n=1 Tax=Operophtera brumata TaxID=104452 RepID=A0A0L7KUI6_OPEBR|nr:hypothetical protein OBRU01_20871 [Operophtera brumata]
MYMTIENFITVCNLLTFIIVVRVVTLILKIYTSECSLINEGSAFKTLLCIGSGGHTTELLRITKRLNLEKYNPRMYIVADNDGSSEYKIHMAEHGRKDFSISKIPRSRNVNQSFRSSVVTTFYATVRSFPILLSFKPNVILCNGPGTCVPICIVAFILRCLFISNCRIIFIESICRVRSLSLTGSIMQYFADVFVVQWPQLNDVCFRAKYFGRLT